MARRNSCVEASGEFWILGDDYNQSGVAVEFLGLLQHGIKMAPLINILSYSDQGSEPRGCLKVSPKIVFLPVYVEKPLALEGKPAYVS